MTINENVNNEDFEENNDEILDDNDEDVIFESLLDYLRQARGFDFSGYKRTSLKRRVRRRMQELDIESFGDYMDYLEVHPEEFSDLFDTTLINVTSFFRDFPAWQYLQQEIIPRILETKSSEEQIRIWSAGCSSGEEAYSLAISFAEVMGVEAFSRRVKIYATDIDEPALVQARQASYRLKDIEIMPRDLQEKYFDISRTKAVFRYNIRRCVIFGRHDLTQDAPISRLDLLVCRNTLMYFNVETQAKMLQRFHFALLPTGFLFLGKAEMLLTHTNLFTPINLPYRFFNKVPRAKLRERWTGFSTLVDDDGGIRLDRHLRLRELAFNQMSVGQLVVDINGKLVLANHVIRSIFNIRLQDIGRSLKDIEIAYHPFDLTSLIQQVLDQGSLVVMDNVIIPFGEEKNKCFEVQGIPLQEQEGQLLGVSVVLIDISKAYELKQELQHSNQELETMNEELQSSGEELETTNEELQSTNEELETTNEELQSTNEELETMNEELHSSNEELQTMNDELRIRTNDVNQLNLLLESILGSINTGVIVVNPQLMILSWNKAATQLWGLRQDEVIGVSLMGLSIGLPTEQLLESISNCLNTQQQQPNITLNTINRVGQSIECTIHFSPLSDGDRNLHGVVILMEGKPILK